MDRTGSTLIWLRDARLSEFKSDGKTDLPRSHRPSTNGNIPELKSLDSTRFGGNIWRFYRLNARPSSIGGPRHAAASRFGIAFERRVRALANATIGKSIISVCHCGWSLIDGCHCERTDTARNLGFCATRPR